MVTHGGESIYHQQSSLVGNLLRDTSSFSQVATINQVMNYFGLQFQKSSKYLAQEVRNTGIKNEVWPKTLKLLDDFFKPYNIRLASLLKDDKWLFIRDHGFK